MENKMGVFSGKVLLGICGEETKLTDIQGLPLFVGDIVCISSQYSGPSDFTVVVRDGFTTYSDGQITQDINGKHFIMGIKDVENEFDWRPFKCKDHKDCIPGEHWKAFGFNYRLLTDSEMADLNEKAGE